ncbi:MAG: universal stress protein [Nitrospirae bacterium]|nr:universal stress protein [Nitrospirota bacterium]
MKTILAVDGSDNSYEAVHALKYFARAEQLTLFHVLDVPKPAYPMMMPEAAEEIYKTLEQSMREDGERLLDRIQSLLPPHAGPSTKQLRIGSPAEAIVAMAEEQKADLIVMGARGLGPVKERLFGSVSHRVLTLAPCATLIVNGPVKAMKEILLPLQGSHCSPYCLKQHHPGQTMPLRPLPLPRYWRSRLTSSMVLRNGFAPSVIRRTELLRSAYLLPSSCNKRLR